MLKESKENFEKPKKGEPKERHIEAREKEGESVIKRTTPKSKRK